MTFSGQLAIWLVCCTAGLLTACGSLRYASLLLHATERRDASDEVRDGTRHLWRTELERAIGWAFFLAIGMIALLSPSEIGLLKWLLISTVALWSFKTVSDFLYARRRWRAIHTPCNPEVFR